MPEAHSEAVITMQPGCTHAWGVIFKGPAEAHSPVLLKLSVYSCTLFFFFHCSLVTRGGADHDVALNASPSHSRHIRKNKHREIPGTDRQ